MPIYSPVTQRSPSAGVCYRKTTTIRVRLTSERVICPVCCAILYELYATSTRQPLTLLVVPAHPRSSLCADSFVSVGLPAGRTDEPLGSTGTSAADVDASPLTVSVVRRFLPVTLVMDVVSAARFLAAPRPGRGAADAADDVSAVGALDAAVNPRTVDKLSLRSSKTAYTICSFIIHISRRHGLFVVASPLDLSQDTDTVCARVTRVVTAAFIGWRDAPTGGVAALDVVVVVARRFVDRRSVPEDFTRDDIVTTAVTVVTDAVTDNGFAQLNFFAAAAAARLCSASAYAARTRASAAAMTSREVVGPVTVLVYFLESQRIKYFRECLKFLCLNGM